MCQLPVIEITEEQWLALGLDENWLAHSVLINA